MKSPTKPRAKAVRFNLFFLEMIIVLLFFSIAAAVILNVFAASDRLAKKSRLTEAMAFCAQSAAEIFSETGSLPQTVEELFGIESANMNEVDIPLDESCKYSPENASLYMRMYVSAEEQEGLYSMHIRFDNGIVINGWELYELYSGAYIPPKNEKAANGDEQ